MKQDTLADNNAADSIYTDMKPLNPTSNLNKKTSRAMELQRILRYKLKFDIMDELISLYRDGEIKDTDRIRILTELMRYQYPQLKAIELDSREGEKINVNIVFPADKKVLTPEEMELKKAEVLK